MIMSNILRKSPHNETDNFNAKNSPSIMSNCLIENHCALWAPNTGFLEHI